jgi:hypothetical protein
MPDAPRLSRRTVLLVLLCISLFFGSASAQSAPQAQQPAPQQPPANATQGQPSAPPPPPPPEPSIESSQPITKAQAKALFHSVDEILQFASHDTGLPVKHKVKRRLITRDQVARYVDQRIKTDKDAQRLERSQLVLMKFGLIPQNYDLHSEFVKLLREQVAAYYDPKTKTVNLLDWVSPELQRPVLAHELTHALQDQAVGLTAWLRAGGKDDDSLPDQQEQVVEEAQAARENVTEGQAMLVMIDYILAPSSLNILKAPDVVDSMRASMTDGKNLPVLAEAPVYLRESLLMPYAFGLDFERAVLIARGTDGAYNGVLQRPPADTLQVMEPTTYLDHATVPPLTIPDLNRLIGPDYERYDFGGMGAFDIYLLSKQYAPDADPKQYYSHWHGGYYLAAHLKSAPKDQVALIFLSHWDSPESAFAFAKLYSGYVPKRYTRNDSAMFPGGESTGIQTFTWPAQNVVIQIRQSDVLVLESFDEATRARISAALLPNPQAAP